MAFDRGDGAVGVHGRLAHGDGAHETLAVFGERDDARGGALAFRVCDDLGLGAFNDGNAAVGGSQVDSDYCHRVLSFFEGVAFVVRFICVLACYKQNRRGWQIAGPKQRQQHSVMGSMKPVENPRAVPCCVYEVALCVKARSARS